MEQNQSFSIEYMLKLHTVILRERGGGQNVNVIMMLIFPQGFWTGPLIMNTIIMHIVSSSCMIVMVHVV